jgi:hypothetical protein
MPFSRIASEEQLNALVARKIINPSPRAAGGPTVVPSGAAAGNRCNSNGHRSNHRGTRELSQPGIRYQVPAATSITRIALLYLLSITFFFSLRIFALLIRLELLTPAGDLVQADTYNKLLAMHGQVMVFSS